MDPTSDLAQLQRDADEQQAQGRIAGSDFEAHLADLPVADLDTEALPVDLVDLQGDDPDSQYSSWPRHERGSCRSWFGCNRAPRRTSAITPGRGASSNQSPSASSAFSSP
jgi:hypothetical protein